MKCKICEAFEKEAEERKNKREEVAKEIGKYILSFCLIIVCLGTYIGSHYLLLIIDKVKYAAIGWIGCFMATIMMGYLYFKVFESDKK